MTMDTPTDSASQSQTTGPRWPRMILGVAMAGGVGWLIDAAILWLLAARLGVPTGIAAVIAFVTSGAANFVLNRSVFGARRTGQMHAHAIRYSVIFAINVLAVGWLVPFLARQAVVLPVSSDMRLLGAKAATTGILLPLNALAYRFWVFRSTKSHLSTTRED